MSEPVLSAEGLGKTYPLPKGELRVFEGLDFELRPGELVVLGGLGRCIACGLCDRGESERIGEAHGGYPGLMTLVLSAARSTTDLGAAAHAFAHLSPETLAEKERDCPTGVPFRELGDYVSHKSAELGGPWPVPGSVVPPPSAYP